jgi:hypothetical protein
MGCFLDIITMLMEDFCVNGNEHSMRTGICFHNSTIEYRRKLYITDSLICIFLVITPYRYEGDDWRFGES